MRLGVVGAGISGLLCAQRLTELVPALHVSILEWGRGPGGRTAHRRVRVPHGGGDDELSFDHAAPHFTATTDAFQDVLRGWEAAGVAAQWHGAGKDVWVGTPASNSVARHLVAGLEASDATMLFGHHVLSAQHDGGMWRVRATDRSTGATADLAFDALVLSDKLLVLPNAYAVLAPRDHGPLALPPSLASTGAVVMLIALERGDVWTGAGAPAQPGARGPVHVVDCSTGPDPHPILARVVHDSAKPGRGGSGDYDQWVVHSRADYAAAHLVEESPTLDDEAAVLAEMQAAFLALDLGLGGGSGAVVAHASVMAWDHAQTAAGSRVAGREMCRVDPIRRAGVCGDFFGDGTEGVEAAALSGIALGEALAPLCDAASGGGLPKSEL